MNSNFTKKKISHVKCHQRDDSVFKYKMALQCSIALKIIHGEISRRKA